MNDTTNQAEPTDENCSDTNVGVLVSFEPAWIHRIIDGIRKTDPAIPMIFSNGGCYQFAVFLQALYPQGELITNWNFDHVRFLIGGVAYDIEGAPYHEHHNWHVMSDDEKRQAEKWSFSKQLMIQIGECPVCDEPLVVA